MTTLIFLIPSKYYHWYIKHFSAILAPKCSFLSTGNWNTTFLRLLAYPILEFWPRGDRVYGISAYLVWEYVTRESTRSELGWRQCGAILALKLERTSSTYNKVFSENFPFWPISSKNGRVPEKFSTEFFFEINFFGLKYVLKHSESISKKNPVKNFLPRFYNFWTKLAKKWKFSKKNFVVCRARSFQLKSQDGPGTVLSPASYTLLWATS